MSPDQLKCALVVIGIVSAVLLSMIFKHEPPPPTTQATTPQVTLSEHERVQAALAAQCTSSNIDIKYVGKDTLAQSTWQAADAGFIPYSSIHTNR